MNVRTRQGSIAAAVGLCVASSILACYVLPCLAAERPKMIVNKSNTVSALGAADLKRMFIGEKLFWSGNKRAKPVIQTGAAKAGFYAMIKMTEADFAKTWIRISLSGRADPPPKVKSDAQVIAYVRGNAGAIGFVLTKADTSSVKVLKIQ
jgi:hypothetical protein